MAHCTREHARKHAHIGMTITTSTYVESLVVLVSNVINKFSLGSKLIGITSDGGTNLARCKTVLEKFFENTVVFDLVKPVFVMELLAHVLANPC